MSDETVYSVPDDWADRAWVDNEKYIEMYQRSVDDPDGFWGEHAHRVDWITPFTKVKNTDFT
ncbi:MAG: acetyl-coenzyme A synthetase N-terminal domain-containing protein, partial [Alphaproteobacteria bacterium]